MKLSSALAFFPFVAIALAQETSITLPAKNATVAAGSSLTIQLVRQDGILKQTEVGVAIGLQSCTTAQLCLSPERNLGSVVYAGSYQPEKHELSSPSYQNFTVPVPSSIKPGPAQLALGHYFLSGSIPQLEYLTVVFTVV